MDALVFRLYSRLPRRSTRPDVDPFRTLVLQGRLTRLKAELQRLDGTGRLPFGCGHHVRATLLAYQHTLDDACRLAGLPVEEGTGPVVRLIAESRLQSAGWQW